MRDVASLAGVDISTVSKVLSGAAISVRPETRERIERAAAELRYRPNASARSLRLSRTGAIGMLVPDFTNAVWAAIVRSAVREAEEQRRVMLVAEMERDQSPKGYLRLVRERRIDGLLIGTARDHSPLQEDLAHDSIPHIFLNRRGGPDSHSVIVDDEEGARVAATALIEAGHRELAIISGPSDVETSRRRLAGFEECRERAGLPTPRLVSAPYSAPGGYAAAQELLEAGPHPTGIFAANLMMGLGALGALSAAGVSVPEEISIVSYDDAELAAFTHPPLTTVAMPHDEMGSIAVRMLEELLAGKEVRSVVVPTPPQLRERASIGPPRG